MIEGDLHWLDVCERSWLIGKPGGFTTYEEYLDAIENRPTDKNDPVFLRGHLTALNTIYTAITGDWYPDVRSSRDEQAQKG
jgi:hypothetical protein